MGGAVSRGEDNDELIDNLVEADYIKTTIVEKVFRAVDRAHYYTEDHRGNAYKDLAWKHGHLHMSAPCIYSEVMESLSLEPGLSFLNLGSGTGYLSTMIGLILGPYGVNHGVEYYTDVVEYANDRLDDFKRNCKTFDDFEFCEPSFVVGNCLNLPTDCMLYDRVYCGAACPPEHENYIKNLLKVGGILVMPLNDQLLQIKRTEEAKWDSKNVMSVSFATLLTSCEETPPITCLPTVELPSLQNVCRTKIRRLLRSTIYKQHPNLNSVRKRIPKKQKRPSSSFKKRINIVPTNVGMIMLSNFESDRSDEDIDEDDEEEEDEIIMRPSHRNNEELDESDMDDDEEDISHNEKTEKDDKIDDIPENFFDYEDEDFSQDEEKNSTKNEAKDSKNRNGLTEMVDNHKESDRCKDKNGASEKKSIMPNQRLGLRLSALNSQIDEICAPLLVQAQRSDAEMEEGENMNNESIEATDKESSNKKMKTESKEEMDNFSEKTELGDENSDDQSDEEGIDIADVFAFHRQVQKAGRSYLTSSTDTSETSGIGSFSEASAFGSFVDEQIEMMANRSSQKTTPDESSPERSYCDQIIEEDEMDDKNCDNNNECDEGIEKDDKKQKFDVENDSDNEPRENIKIYMQEMIYQLPLPEAMKAYINYYRN